MPLHALIVSAGLSTRPKDLELALALPVGGSAALQLEYIDEGRQPQGIENINRALSLDIASHYDIGRLSLSLKGGLTSSRLSYNGSGNGYANRSGLTGWNAGVGIQSRLTERWSIGAELLRLHYQQSDKPAMEYYSFAYAFLSYRIGGSP